MRGCLVTATDTGVGKTVLAAAIAAALRRDGNRVAAYKPIVTGLDEPEPDKPADHELLAAVTGQRPETVSPHRYGPAVSPHLATRLAGDRIEREELFERALAAAAEAEVLVVEGVGGLMVPLTDDWLVLDIARALGFPVVIAARPGLGTIGHSLLTIRVARDAGLDVRAVVLTPWPSAPTELERSNHETIARLGDVHVDVLPEISSFEPKVLADFGAALAPERWLAAPVAPVPTA